MGAYQPSHGGKETDHDSLRFNFRHGLDGWNRRMNWDGEWERWIGTLDLDALDSAQHQHCHGDNLSHKKLNCD